MSTKSLAIYSLGILLSASSVFIVGLETYKEKLDIFLSGFTEKSEGLNMLFSPLIQLEAFVFVSIPFIVFTLCLLVKVLFIDDYKAEN